MLLDVEGLSFSFLATPASFATTAFALSAAFATTSAATSGTFIITAKAAPAAILPGKQGLIITLVVLIH